MNKDLIAKYQSILGDDIVTKVSYPINCPPSEEAEEEVDKKILKHGREFAKGLGELIEQDFRHMRIVN